MLHLKPKAGFYLALAATLMAIAVVVLGAFTRLVDAGLGCPDWPTCYGHFWAPQTAQEISLANQSYPEIPVDLDKTWPEMVHRYLASSLGVLIIAIVVSAFRNRNKATEKQPLKLPIFLLAFVILQGAFGAWTVTLKLWPQVVTAHLLGGFTTFTLLAILTLRLSGLRFKKIMQITRKPKKLAALALLAVILQVFLGGWTTSNYAALACPDFPKCQTQWWPSLDFDAGFNFSHPIGPNYQGGQMDIPARTAIHLSHRLGAIVVTALVMLLAWALFQQRMHYWALTLMLLLSAQLMLGISNVIFGLPLFIAVLHNLGGALLLMTTAVINLILNRKEPVYV